MKRHTLRYVDLSKPAEYISEERLKQLMVEHSGRQYKLSTNEVDALVAKGAVGIETGDEVRLLYKDHLTKRVQYTVISREV